jgi:hypothetical protein
MLTSLSADLKESKTAVIVGAPPPPDVSDKRGRRMFVSGKIDYKGLKRPAPSKQRPIPADVTDPDEDSDDTPLVHPQRQTRSSKTVTKSSAAILKKDLPPTNPQTSAMKKPSQSQDPVIDLDESSSDHDNQHGGGRDSDSDCEDQQLGTKRKPERKDRGGAKKRVHIVLSSDEEEVVQTTGREDSKQPDTKTRERDAEMSKDDPLTVTHKVADDQSQDDSDPFLGK